MPTLLGMLSVCVVTAADGVFVGRGVGSDAVAAVNIVWAPLMLLIGVGLMLGIGCSVVASIYLAQGDVLKARRNVAYAILTGSLIGVLSVVGMLASPSATCYLLGSSETLLEPAVDYLVCFAPAMVMNIWSLIGLFIVRLDGSPRFAMWCNVIPGLLNIFLDYLFIFPLGMGIKGAAVATAISVTVGGVMTMAYLTRFARTLRLTGVSLSRAGVVTLIK
ncbi:MAG: polysaccharide biosynthesis C-terminal domain-containing protein, partial [Duncaniella sp.]|nr:polysaccharide biosynthesis C-terminal domain-containing protein [Duncaniella sp.]